MPFRDFRQVNRVHAARELRLRMTPFERILWRALRNRQLDGLKFRRQHEVGPFVLDFYCPDHRLGIELDGNIHDLQADYDAERTRLLEAHGYRILRFRNSDILSGLPGVLSQISAATRKIPSPSDRERGLGGEGCIVTPRRRK